MEKTTASGIKILIADDHQMVRKGLSTLIDAQPDMEVVCEVSEGRTAVELALRLAPDLVLMDVTMPGMNGIVATQKIISKRPDIKIIGLSMHSDESIIAEMLKAGASGYLLKECPFDKLVNAIHTVLDGRIFLGPNIVNIVARDYVRRLPDEEVENAPPDLSDRELEILQLIAEGVSTKQIASNLHVSIKTIDTHRLNIMRKLDAHSIAELTKYAIRQKITAL